MARRATMLARGQLTGNLDTYATVPAGKKWEVTEVLVVNISGATQVFRLQLGGVYVIYTPALAANSYNRFPFFTVMNSGDLIKAVGSANEYLYVSGIEVDVA